MTQLSILLGWVKEKYCLRTISVNVLKTGYKWKALYKFCTTCYNSHHKLLLNSIVFVVFFSMFMLSSTSWQGWFLGQISWTEHTLPQFAQSSSTDYQLLYFSKCTSNSYEVFYIIPKFPNPIIASAWNKSVVIIATG